MEINGVIVAAEIRALSAICGSFRDATRPFRLLLLLPCPRASTSPWDGLIGGLHPRRARPIACSRARAAGVRAEVCATYCTSARSCSRQDIKHPSKGDVERKIDFENTNRKQYDMSIIINSIVILQDIYRKVLHRQFTTRMCSLRVPELLIAASFSRNAYVRIPAETPTTNELLPIPAKTRRRSQHKKTHCMYN